MPSNGTHKGTVGTGDHLDKGVLGYLRQIARGLPNLGMRVVDVFQLENRPFIALLDFRYQRAEYGRVELLFCIVGVGRGLCCFGRFGLALFLLDFLHHCGLLSPPAPVSSVAAYQFVCY